jgi:mono/diheme cytochrome c family protein
MLPVLVAVALGTGACSGDAESPTDRAAAERGRQVYLAQCTACHASDPALPGPVGPPVKGVSEALLAAKIVRGTYPPGYTPKRPTAVMPVQPALAPDIPALAAYLQ